MKLFDSHCHLDDRAYNKDIDKIIEHAKNAGVVAAMIVGIDKNSSSKAVAIAESYEGCYASIGIHPHNAKTVDETTLNFLNRLAENPKVLAWGEIGLDYNRMVSPKKDQEKWFVKQLEIADEHHFPVIFHERDSHGRFYEILQNHFQKGRDGVIHCFSGNITELKQYLDLGLHIGITGILTIKSRGAHLRHLVPYIPMERILIETDAPYLTPAPEKNRTHRNEPAFARSVLLKLAEVREEDPEYLSGRIWENTCRLFRLKSD